MAWLITPRTEQTTPWIIRSTPLLGDAYADRCKLSQLDEINWGAVHTNRWSGNGVCPSIKEGKQAEFLMEHSFPWLLVERIGVHSMAVFRKENQALTGCSHRPNVEIITDWYY